MKTSVRADLPTVIAAGILVYFVANVMHEGVGHGGACLAVGGKIRGLSTAWLLCDEDGLPRSAARLVSAAGTFANLALGAVFYLLARRARPSAFGYVAWLAMVVNLLQGGGYLMVSPFLGYGDWASVLGDVSPGARLPFQLLLTAIGAAISLFTVYRGRTLLAPFLPADRQAREARWLCLLPYGVGGLVFLAASFRDPKLGIALVGLLTAHVFGTCWLAFWLPFLVKDGPTPAGAPVPRAPALWLAAAIATAICIGVLGPSVFGA